MKPPIIGITGKARAGKDTTANLLVAMLGGYKYSFADPIRAMLRPLGIDMNDPYWMDRKEDIIPAFGKSPRQMMQTLGTEWGREMVHPDIWLILAKDALLRKGSGMIVSDVRFDNEATLIRMFGGTMIHVQRDAAPGVTPHKSENGVEILPSDYVIKNNGSIEDLQVVLKKYFGNT